MYIIRIDDDDYDDYSVFNMRTISVDNGLENFFSGNIGIGEDQNINLVTVLAIENGGGVVFECVLVLSSVLWFVLFISLILTSSF